MDFSRFSVWGMMQFLIMLCLSCSLRAGLHGGGGASDHGGVYMHWESVCSAVDVSQLHGTAYHFQPPRNWIHGIAALRGGGDGGGGAIGGVIGGEASDHGGVYMHFQPVCPAVDVSQLHRTAYHFQPPKNWIYGKP
ncbi:hypothetical protein BUALT_Bualt11G0094000 [Buddleja alternifolia]|uniref:Secreted protein n=1 Tax=Buddleja alternifolia TaxID=168488 RepID=A0AAV6X046_9LAMI|nr:hypothetical protein BUALT_Bualt11G0094000 [Buddleja alternifolia]